MSEAQQASTTTLTWPLDDALHELENALTKMESIGALLDALSKAREFEGKALYAVVDAFEDTRGRADDALKVLFPVLCAAVRAENASVRPPLPT